MNWVVKYSMICVGTIVALLAVTWVLSGASLGGLGTQGIIALALGVVVTVAVAVGLMALTFLHGHDEKGDGDHEAKLPKSGPSSR